MLSTCALGFALTDKKITQYFMRQLTTRLPVNLITTNTVPNTFNIYKDPLVEKGAARGMDTTD